MEYIDGYNCVNIYSKGKTQLGRDLSNFADIPITGRSETGEVHQFRCVEAWWYWYTTGKIHHHLKTLVGWEAKRAGRKLPRVENVTADMFKAIAVLKLKQNAWLFREFCSNTTLTYVHFYDYGGKQVFNEHDITAPVWNELMNIIKSGGRLW